MTEFVREDVKVSILGKDYAVRELSLAEKNKLFRSIGGLIRSIAGSAFFRKKDGGGIAFDWVDEVSLAELNFDKIILESVDALPELLRMAVPDFNDWDNIPESVSRQAVLKAVELQDFKGYVANFFSLAASLIR